MMDDKDEEEVEVEVAALLKRRGGGDSFSK